MNKKAQIGAIIGTLFAIFVIAVIIYCAIWGIHVTTTTGGHHTGTVTAVEDNGLIFRTTTVYFKTNIQSSQEDLYCVINQSVRQQLDYARQNQKTVTIEYISYISSGYKYCNDEPAIITGVSGQ